MKYLDVLNEGWNKHKEPRHDNAPTVISTFAGCGGSSLGYSMAGFKELLAVEWEENAAKTFRANFPEVDLYHGDIAALSVPDILQRTGLKQGELDVFDGSPPCQGFSMVGNRDFKDNRNQLFVEFVRLLTGLMPKVFVMENVTGMVKGKMKVIFVQILKELKAVGYDVSARVLNSKCFNVAQARERIIFIGVRSDLNIKPSHPKPTGKRVFNIADAIGDLPVEQDPSIDHTWIDESPNGKNTPAWQKASKVKQGEAYITRGKAGGFKKLRNYWYKPFPTITKTQGLLTISACHPIHTRVYSVREFARGGSFPDQFQFFDGKGSERIGNSVPPLLMRAIAEHIKDNILANVK